MVRGAGRCISTASASIPPSSMTTMVAIGSSLWSGILAMVTNTRAPSFLRSSTPSTGSCAAQPPASTAAAPTADAWRAPHLYKRNGFYYLMAAEGGTGYGHGVTLARSRDIAGPYQPGPVNPFLTSNPAPYFGRNDHDFLRPQLYNPYAELQKAGHGSSGGHADGRVVRGPSVCASARSPHQRSVLGRETAIQKVEWTEDGWLRLTTGGTLARL